MGDTPKWLQIAGLGLQAVSTGASIASSARELKRQKEAMRYQDQINDENYSKQLADQVLLTEKFRDEDRAYNDFGAVVRRAKAAGVNPYAALGVSGGIGVSSSSNVPSPSQGSPSSVPNSELPATLTSAASSLPASLRSYAFFEAELRQKEAEAKSAEIEAAWADRNFDINYREKQSNIALQDARIGTEEQRKRLVTLQGNMQEILNSQQGPLGDAKLRKLSEEIRLFGLEADGLEIKNSKQAEILDSQIAESKARVYETYESVRQKYIELEQNAEKLNLSKSELEEVKRANKALEKFRDEELEFKESSDKKNRTQRYILGSVNAACRVADTVAGFINPLKNIASSRPALSDSWSDSGYIFAD